VVRVRVDPGEFFIHEKFLRTNLFQSWPFAGLVIVSVFNFIDNFIQAESAVFSSARAEQSLVTHPI
jgi:hypothetical protein